MKQVTIRECPSYVMEEVREVPVELPAEVYRQRLNALARRIGEKGLDFAVLYGDREHFSNIEYFTKYDCRFEEALFIVSAGGDCTIVVGNEGEAYCAVIPCEVQVLRYHYFSLQGQPVHGSTSLAEVLEKAGVSKGTKLGLAGYKCRPEAEGRFDVPEFIVQALREVTGESDLADFTPELIGLPNGLRMTLRSTDEIAVIDYRAAKVANAMRRMLRAARPGMSEEELSKAAQVDFAPQQTHSMVNFGAESIAMGIKSPSPFVRLVMGGPMSMAFSQRGSLMCRAALAAEDEKTILPRLRPMLEEHIMVYWSAVAAWYETLRVGCTGGELYDTVASYIGAPRFGFGLNPGHYIGGDEWVNTDFLPGAKTAVHSGSHIQCDIIAAANDPVLSAICEDTVVVADEALRRQLEKDCPELYGKILMRRQFMRESLGINLQEDILPMGEMNAVMFPFMLNPRRMLAFE